MHNIAPHASVFGLGKAGRGALNWLLARGWQVSAWDDNEIARARIQSDYPQVPLIPVAEQDWAHITRLILSPGVPLHHPKPHPVVQLAQEHHTPIMCEVELLREGALTGQPHATTIAITGTNGKSTTSALVHHCLKETGRQSEIGGNFGTPACSLPTLPAEGFYVLELSSYQLELLPHFTADIAALLNITPDHLDRHGTMENYVSAKASIFDSTKGKIPQRQTAIIATDDHYTKKIFNNLNDKDHKVINASLENGLVIKNPSLAGNHNAQNMKVAQAILRECGLSDAEIRSGLESFPGLPHRMFVVGTHNGVTFVNDSKATNAEAAKAALSTYHNIFWIAGGLAKAEGIAPLKPYFSRITHAFLIGDAADDFSHYLTQENIPNSIAGTLEKAMQMAGKAARSAGSGVVLLSPACASFDQFPNFEARGCEFENLVKEFISTN